MIRMMQGKLLVKSSIEVDIRDSLSITSCFNSCSFHFVHRSCNMVAHEIAKYALSSESPSTWLGDFQRSATAEVPFMT